MMMKKTLACIPVLASFAVMQAQPATSAAAQDQKVRINQIQVIGTHNSYHTGLAPSEHKWLEQVNAKAMRSLDYGHAPLVHQLSGGVRQIEIDVFADSKGGRYAHPAVVRKVAAAGLPADPDFDPQHEMDKPGFKVMHVQDLDERSSCHTLIACLTQVRTWSQQHPSHLPIFILIETKEHPLSNSPDTVQPEPFTSAVFDALDAEIRSVFASDEMITPDQVRGGYDTLNEAILAKPEAQKNGGWPTLAESRGKVVFLMDQRPVGPVYLQGHPSLRGRVLFTNAEPGSPDAAFVEQNDGTPEQISALVRQGYLIRTRTDDGTEEARSNDHARANRAIESGAQMLSTDYPASEPASWTGFSVSLPAGAVARCNPINRPPDCIDSLLEPSENR
jgi:hypothetical protein